MATASVGPFSAWDPLASLGEQWMGSSASFAWNGKDLRRNVRYQKRMIRFQNQQNREQASWSAKEMPSLQMAGLTKAGLNPILSVTGSGGFHTDSAVSAGGADIPSSESYTPGGNSNTGFSGSFDDLLKLFSPKKQREIIREGQETTLANSKADRAEAETRQVTADAERDMVRSLLGFRFRKAHAEAESAEHSAASSGLSAFLDSLKTDFAHHWLFRRGSFDDSVDSFLKFGTNSDDVLKGRDNEFFKLLMSTMRNQLRDEDWKFLRNQLDAGVNAAKGVGEVYDNVRGGRKKK